MSKMKFFIVTLAFFFLLWGLPLFTQKLAAGQLAISKEKKTTAQQVAAIDDQIQELEEMKRGYESRALRHDDQALRLQFNQEWNLEVRRHLELAEENRKKAEVVQQEIDRLKEKRKRLLDQYGGWDGFEDL